MKQKKQTNNKVPNSRDEKQEHSEGGVLGGVEDAVEGLGLEDAVEGLGLEDIAGHRIPQHEACKDAKIHNC